MPGIVHVEDWVHIRRKFKDTIKGRKLGTKTTFADHALGVIEELYGIENECQDSAARLHARQTYSRQVIADLGRA